MKRTYAKRWGVLHNAAVRREIDSLGAQRDTQRIVHLLVSYEFSWDIRRALEVALLYTYASAPVAKLLDRTGEFANHGQKRYDDTALLIGHFVESGWDGDFGRRAIERMNNTHAHYRIANDEFLFVLWTFIEFPMRWTERYGRRRMTAHEKQAWFNFWRKVGRRMNIRDIPDTQSAFDDFIRRYEDENFVYTDANKRVSDASIRIMENWLPPGMRFPVRRVVSCLMPRQFLQAVGYPQPPAWQRGAVEAALRVYGLCRRPIAFGNYPGAMTKFKQRTYPSGYTIEAIEPANLAERRERRRRRTQAGTSQPETADQSGADSTSPANR